jgi:beta-lactam-binding protein with PASTA domain
VHCEVPRLAGKTLTQARSLLSRGNCALGKVGRRYSTKRKGTVIAQRPRPGSNMNENARVDVTLSKGRRPQKHPRALRPA